MKNRSLTFALLVCLFSVACKKSEPEHDIERDQIVDRQGHTYETVKIGEQWWMSENLKVTVFNDSTALQNISGTVNDSVWSKNTKPAYCELDQRYGLLYNFEAITNAKQLAPKGWHIATDADWMQLEKFLGLSETMLQQTGWRGTNESAELIPENSVGWPNSDQLIYGTNKSGFSALPGGCRLFNGTKGEVSSSGYWWTATPQSPTHAYYRNIHASHGEIFRYFADKRYGFSVRCVKNN